MNYLAIDTSGTHLTVILCKDDKVYKYFRLDCGVDHSTALMTEVEKLTIEAFFDLKNADFFASVVGAGSFTGIRIGVSAIKAMCLAFDKKCVSVTSFDTLAYNKQGGKILAVIDARHGYAYACGYYNQEVVIEPQYISYEEVKALSAEYKLVSGTMIDGLETEIVSLADGLEKAILYKKDKKDFLIAPDKLEPLYIRKSQAEEHR